MRPDVALILRDGLIESGVDFAASLPEKNLEPFVALLREDIRVLHVPLAREEEGIGICTGAYLGGRTPCMVMMNAGFLTCVNALTLAAQYAQIPMLLIIGNNGGFGEQYLMHTPLARATAPVLDAVRIPTRVVTEPEMAKGAIADSMSLVQSSRLPVAIVLDGACLRD